MSPSTTFTPRPGVTIAVAPGRIESTGLRQPFELEASPDDETEQAIAAAIHNAAIDGMEALLLALASEGIDLSGPQYHRAVNAALDAIGNQLD